jgi:hypothetical protein
VTEQFERIQVADEDQFFKSVQAILRCNDQKELNAHFRLGWGEFKKQAKEMETMSDDK